MNEKITNLKESAYKYYKDLNEIKDTIEICNKIIRDKNYNILFDDSITNFNGDILKGKIITLENQEIEIRINPNFNHVFTIIHELTHAIETKELKKLVLDYVNKHNEYNSYKIDDASEVLANITEKFLGNKEFINTLSLDCPSISKRIYNIIISLRNKITFNYKEKYFLKELEVKFRNAYRTENNNLNNIKYSTKTLKDGTTYVRTENNLFLKKDGTKMNQREIYGLLVGKKIKLNDGLEVKIVNRLPKKDMYNELFKRYPRNKNLNNIKEINNRINENIEELLKNSNYINVRSDVNNRHVEQKIANFNTREVLFYDGNQTYKLTLSIAILQDGTRVAYSKKMIKVDNELFYKIKQEGMSSTSSNGRSSQFPQVDNNISQIDDDVK